MEKTIESLAPVEIKRIGGCGNKVNQVALNNADAYCQPAAGLKFWDLCAPECIIRAMGGLCTDADGNRLVYDAKRNKNGVKFPGFYIGQTQKIH